MDSRKLVWIGGTVSAVLAGIYVLWGPNERRNRARRKDKCPGLVNLGNTCFLNAILQSLASCPTLIRWLGDFIDRRKDISSTTNYLAWTLDKVLKVLTNEDLSAIDPYSPSEVITALRTRNWVISADEQDAHELFHVLTETIDEETTKYPHLISLLDVEQLYRTETFSDAVHRLGVSLPLLPENRDDHPFKGLLASQLRCKVCSYKSSVKYQSFDSLSLSLPSHCWAGLTLDSLLHDFFITESVHNVECEGCAMKAETKTSPKTTFTKRLTLGKLPDCLCIHIQRTVWLNNGVPMKRFEHISFPEVLHLDDYVYQRKQRKIRTEFTGLYGGNVIRNSGAGTSKTPNSGQFNLLKALNYQSRTTMNGIYIPPPNKQLPPGGNGAVAGDVGKLWSVANLDRFSLESYSYKLTSVIGHLGDVFSGHFVTYKRAPSLSGQTNNKWLYTSDMLVKTTRFSDVLAADAYMLFYERC